MIKGGIWWITGASSGLGASMAKSFAAAGANLILSGRNEAALKSVAASCETESLVLPFDTIDFDALPTIVDKAWSWAAERGKGVTGLINNAGVSQRSLAVDTVFDVYRRIIDVDLLAPIALTQAVLPRMVAVGGGHIVAVSSVAGLIGAPLRSAYSAAKHGLVGYNDVVRAETDHLGVKVLVVAPGSIRTNVSKNALGATGQARGYSDDVIDQGMDPDIAATRIREAVEAGTRELVLAEGMEADLVRLRRADPNALFDTAARMIAQGYAAKMGASRPS
ncbi:MAG: SDR family NAD(P)-dependent oxidoreductase [Hyphomonadaceae bacterium]|nr:SDR family NAD(P)-dependent oxidoreductase [Hyphomonadaceae bacterium]